jgi:hypothetical protein
MFPFDRPDENHAAEQSFYRSLIWWPVISNIFFPLFWREIREKHVAYVGVYWTIPFARHQWIVFSFIYYSVLFIYFPFFSNSSRMTINSQI